MSNTIKLNNTHLQNLKVDNVDRIGVKVDNVDRIGVKGDNGVSPIVNVEKIKNGHRVTITDVNGTKSFDILNGDNTLKIDHTLKFNEQGALGVHIATEVEKDNTLPITSAAVSKTVGNIEILLGTI